MKEKSIARCSRACPRLAPKPDQSFGTLQALDTTRARRSRRLRPPHLALRSACPRRRPGRWRSLSVPRDGLHCVSGATNTLVDSAGPRAESSPRHARGRRSTGPGAPEASVRSAAEMQHPRPGPAQVRINLERAHSDSAAVGVDNADRLVHADPIVAVMASGPPILAWHLASVAPAPACADGVSPQTARGLDATTAPLRRRLGVSVRGRGSAEVTGRWRLASPRYVGRPTRCLSSVGTTPKHCRRAPAPPRQGLRPNSFYSPVDRDERTFAPERPQERFSRHPMHVPDPLPNITTLVRVPRRAGRPNRGRAPGRRCSPRSRRTLFAVRRGLSSSSPRRSGVHLAPGGL